MIYVIACIIIIDTSNCILCIYLLYLFSRWMRWLICWPVLHHSAYRNRIWGIDKTCIDGRSPIPSHLPTMSKICKCWIYCWDAFSYSTLNIYRQTCRTVTSFQLNPGSSMIILLTSNASHEVFQWKHVVEICMQKKLSSWLKLLHTVLCKTVLQCCELFLSWEEKSCQFCIENHKGNPLRERFSEWEQEANGTEANPRVSHSSLLCVHQRRYHKLTYLSFVNEQNSEMDIIQLKCFFPPHLTAIWNCCQKLFQCCLFCCNS